jgi:L-lysine 2,3-aminomutase
LEEHMQTQNMTKTELIENIEILAEKCEKLIAELAQRTAALDQMTVHRNATIEHRDITQQVLNGITVALSQRTADLARVTAERDEARRWVCRKTVYAERKPHDLVDSTEAKVLLEAQMRGWDCFAKEG